MKTKALFISTLCALYVAGNAAPPTQKNIQPDEWQHKSFETDSVYGAGINNAYRLVEGRKPAKTVTVALVGHAVDINQADLAGVIWTNPKEKPNGKDDDANGYVDDIHGWNFLGTPDGKVLSRLSRVGDREFFRLKDKYAHYLFVDNKCYTFDTLTQRVVETTPPPDREEFDYFRLKVLPEVPIGGRHMGVMFAKMVVSFVHETDSVLRQKFPGKALTKQDFEKVYDGYAPDTLTNSLAGSVQLLFMSVGSEKWDDVVKYAASSYVPYQQRAYEKQLNNTPLNERRHIGDDPYDLNDKPYGNNNLTSGSYGRGAKLAGVIGAKRHNGIGVDGVAANVRIMPLRIEVETYGEPYMKDMANAIRYAVNQGADIIQLGSTNALYPKLLSEWVDEALRYAEEKGVLVVIPVMDLSYNLDDKPFYPSRHVAGGDLRNIITVAASDDYGFPYRTVNFSNKEVDLFAPGVGIKSLPREGEDPIDSGSEFAAAVVSGVAALIKSYYPQITPAEMRELLMKTVTPRGDTEVVKSFVMFDNGTAAGRAKDVFLFTELCVSGGILNAEKAMAEAEKRYGK
jgi:subtilisin family serine protease